MRAKPKAHHLETVAATLRGLGTLSLLSPFNEKSPKGEAYGYLTAMMYLAPHTVAGGKSVCPHSTAACREGCLFTAGRGTTPRVANARIKRTLRYLDGRPGFMRDVVADLTVMQQAADDAGLTLAIRLNGTSDIAWERENPSVFEAFPRAIFYDYCRWPPQHRKVPANWHLTFSLADDPLSHAITHLVAGRSVAAIVPEREKAAAPDWFVVGDKTVQVVDGELHDLRFLDPSPSLVLLKPKGRLRRGGPMVHEHLIENLYRLGRDAA